MSEITEMWLTKYALSEGISKEMVVLSTHSGLQYASRVDGYGFFRVDSDAHADESAAIAAAEQMRIKKIASLKKQIVKLEKLVFSK